MAVVERTIQKQGIQPLGRIGNLAARILTYGLALVALVLVAQQGWQSGERWYGDIVYGYPRSVSLTAYVGHGNERSFPTLVQTFNLNGQVSVLVAPGGDMKQSHVLEGPYIVGQDGAYAVAYPTLRDVNGDGHVDLMINVRNELIVYINENSKFRLMTMEERAALPDTWYKE
jgi:hypothetical protein